MTLFEKTIQALKNKDFELLQRIHHEDIMFVREFSMYSRDEHLAYLASIAERLPNANWQDHAQCVHEDDFVLIMRYPETHDKSVSYFTSNVSIKHEGVYWRTMVKKDE